MELITFVALIVLYLVFSGRIKRLEERLDNMENRTLQSSVEPRPIPPADAAQRPMYEGAKWQGQSDSFAPVTPSVPSAFDKFIDWIKEDFMVKLGAFLLILALGWFVSYAILEQWIGPAGQIMLGLLAGTAFLGLGAWRIQKFRHQGGIFTILGATTILLTVFAARSIYEFFTYFSALSLMFFTVVFVAFVSVRYQSEKLALTSLLLASIAPFLTDSMPVPALEIFTYLLVVTLGTLWVVWVTGWTRLTLASLIISYLYSVAFMFDGRPGDLDTTLIFSFIFVSLFFAANMVSLVRRHGEGSKHMMTHTVTALGTAIFLFTWVEEAVTPEWRSLIYTAWALIFAVGTYVVYMFTANRSAFYLYGATSIALIGVATAAELEGQVLTLAYLLEVSVLVLAAARLGASARTLSLLSMLMVVPVLFSLPSLNQWLWKDGVFNEHFVVVSMTMIALFALGFLLKEKKDKEGAELSNFTATGLITTGAVYAVALVWLVFHTLFTSDLATMLSLIVYTIAGIVLFVFGTTHGQKAKRVAGGVLIGLVILRLLFIEVWDMNLEGRIITFLIIGLMLISTAFIGKLRHPVNAGSENK